MNRDVYSNTDFTDLKNRLNQEIKRRGTFKWWDPLTTPSIGEDRSSPLSIPNIGDRVIVDDKTYTINNPSDGSIEPTRNINYPSHGENPAGQNPDRNSSVPNTSAAQFNVDEIKNMLIGLAKMQDINLFYGRDEINNTAFRDPKGIEDALINAENSLLNKPLAESDCFPTKNDPNGGNVKLSENYPNENFNVTYPMDRNGNYVMPSGEYDGEELKNYDALGPTNFYDDYGAKPGDSDFHPYNRFISELVNRDWYDQDNNRNTIVTKVREGGVSSKRFGPNPRNPEQGNEYRSRPVYGGVVGNCNTACTGLCYLTCDNQCSESCSSTCWSRCGNACTSDCGNVCTGCSTLCFSSCKTKCENSTGYSCLKAGAKTVKISAVGGKDGIPVSHKIEVTTHSCTGCSYSCQFYPNKKTECWDSGCMGKCFTSCTTSCSTSCFGGCVNNDPQEGNSYRTGKGRGCDGGCTLNCVGLCEGTCDGYCVQTCWHACKQKCSDNCSWKCTTNCGNGCASNCSQTCTGCSSECSGSCKGQSENTACSGCSMEGGCVSTCSSDCNSNCMGFGCRSVCGTEGGNGSCEANCRMNCTGTSCTSMCSDACSDQCTTCVNTCGWQCGACSSSCSSGCSQECNITCSAACEHSCESNCVMSCSETCGGCSNLCYSCVGMCIGVCFKAGTLIETINGPVPIEEIKVGDMVLTQSGEYHKVINSFSRMTNGDSIKVQAIGAPVLYTTKEHPFWTKEVELYENTRYIKSYKNPKWINASDLKSRDKVKLLTPNFGDISVDPGIAYMVGRWLGDGWRTDERYKDGKITTRFSICCGKHEEADFELKLEQCNIITSKRETNSTISYRIPRERIWGHSKVEFELFNNNELISILEKCGKGSTGKYLSQEIMNWDKISLSYLLQGYLDADGNISKIYGLDYTRFVTVSKKLAYQLSMIMRMFGRNPSWHVKEYSSNDTGIIEGRTVNLHTRYSIGTNMTSEGKTSSTTYESETDVWGSIRYTRPVEYDYKVYNITVEGDPTYYADGILVHNCSVKCENGCSSCANNCGWWCDSTCNQACFSTCDNLCIETCMGSCVSFLESKTTNTTGAERNPTSNGYIYPNPKNRWEERESFKIIRDIIKPNKEDIVEDNSLIFITTDIDRNLSITCPDDIIYVIKQTVITGGVFTYDEEGNINIDEEMLPGIIDSNKPNIDNGGGLYIIIFDNNDITDDDISSKLPFGFELHPVIKSKDNKSIIIIERDQFLYPEEGNEVNG